MLDYVIIEARRQPQNEIVLTKRIARDQRIGVGRTDSADLVVNDDPEISSLHFLVAVSDDACTVTDQNSTNKTFYNGRPITQINIGDGERILCGKTEFIFRLVSTVDDSSSVRPFVHDQPRPAPGIKPTPVPASKGDPTPPAERSTEVKRVPDPQPIQPPLRKQTQPATPVPSTRKPAAPVFSSSNNPVPAAPTDSGDLINWSMFSEEEPATGHAFVVEKETLESEKTRVIIGPAPVGNIVQVVIGIAGHSDPSARLVMDPRQNSKAVIGRAATSHLPCPLDPSMSKRHFAIEIQDNQCLIRDLNSCNGTALNGQRILIAPLRHGDRVCAGTTDFEIAIEETR